MVASTKGAANLEERSISLFAHQVHGYLARPHNIAVALFPFEAFRINVVVVADAFKYLQDGQCREGLALAIQVLKCFGREVD